jgi:hypothetical protein
VILLSAKLKPMVNVNNATIKYPQIDAEVPPVSKVVPHIYHHLVSLKKLHEKKITGNKPLRTEQQPNEMAKFEKVDK